MQIPIAIVSFNKEAVSETFIHAHRKYLDGDIHYLHDGVIPTKINGEPISNYTGSGAKLFQLLPYFYFQRHFSQDLNHKILAAYLNKKKIKVLLAEYGPAGAALTPICKSLNIPLIVHFHGFDASVYDEVKKLRQEYLAMFEYSKYVVSVSDGMTNRLRNLGCPPQKIVNNPYGPDDRFFDINPDIQNGYFLAVGRFVEKKAPFITILAFAKLQELRPQAKLVMIGNGPLLGACKRLAQSLNCRIDFKTDLPHENVMHFFTEAAFFVQHSVIADNGDREGTPVGILEACAAGLCVISTRHEGISEVIVDGQTGFLVEEGDIDGMFRFMINAFDDRTLAGNVGKKAKDRVSQHFTMKKHIGALNQLISSAIV